MMQKRTASVLILVCALVLLTLRSYLHQRRIKQRFLSQGIRSGPSIPIFGDVLRSLTQGGINNAAEISLDFHRTVGPVGIFWLMDTPILKVADPDWLKVIMGSKYVVYNRSKIEQELFGDLLGGGLILENNGERWKAHRQLLTNGFHQSRLVASLEDIGKRTQRFLNRITVGKSVEIQELLQELTFEIMCSFSLGLDSEDLPDEGQGSIAQLWFDVLNHTQSRFTAPFPYWKFFETSAVAKWRRGLEYLRKLCNKAIDGELEKKTEGQQSILSFMVARHLESPELFTRHDIVQHALTFLFAGHDTTTNLLTFMFYHIGKDPEIKAKCVEELEELFAGKDINHIPTFTEVKALRYLRMVAKETLRLYPGAPLRGRTVASDDIPVDPVFVEDNMMVTIDIYSCHMLFWPDPEKFDPERFSEENERERPTHHFIPFGFGSRRCIGEQMAMNEALAVMAMALRRFDITTDANNQIHRELTLTMRAKHGVNVTLKSRQ